MKFSGDFCLNKFQFNIWKLNTWVKNMFIKNLTPFYYQTTSLVQTRDIGFVELMYKRPWS